MTTTTTTTSTITCRCMAGLCEAYACDSPCYRPRFDPLQAEDRAYYSNSRRMGRIQLNSVARARLEAKLRLISTAGFPPYVKCRHGNVMLPDESCQSDTHCGCPGVQDTT